MKITEIYIDFEIRDGKYVYIGNESDGRKIHIPQTTTINGMFQNNKNLIYPPELPDNVEDISWAFAGCENLIKAPTIKNGVKNANGAFSGCKNLKEGSMIPSTVETGNWMYEGCVSMKTKITKPSSLKRCIDIFKDVPVYFNED